MGDDDKEVCDLAGPHGQEQIKSSQSLWLKQRWRSLSWAVAGLLLAAVMWQHQRQRLQGTGLSGSSRPLGTHGGLLHVLRGEWSGARDQGPGHLSYQGLSSWQSVAPPHPLSFWVCLSLLGFFDKRGPVEDCQCPLLEGDGTPSEVCLGRCSGAGEVNAKQMA